MWYETTCSTDFNSVSSERDCVRNQNNRILLQLLSCPFENDDGGNGTIKMWWWWFLLVWSNINMKHMLNHWTVCASVWLSLIWFSVGCYTFALAHRSIPFGRWSICCITYNREFQPIVRVCDVNQVRIRCLFWSGIHTDKKKNNSHNKRRMKRRARDSKEKSMCILPFGAMRWLGFCNIHVQLVFNV